MDSCTSCNLVAHIRSYSARAVSQRALSSWAIRGRHVGLMLGWAPKYDTVMGNGVVPLG